MTHFKYHNHNGFTMVEVLVALVILTLGLLGLAGLQAQSLSGSTGASLRSQANLYIFDIAERMRTNRTVAISSDEFYEIDFGDTPALSLPTLVKSDLQGWLNEIATLPNGEGQIELSTGGTGTEAVISVRYNDKSGTRTLAVETQL